MATGIDTDKVSNLKVDLLGYTESVNAIINRLDNCKTTIQANMDGAGKTEIIKVIDAILEQMPKVNTNINSYIGTINKMVKTYEENAEGKGYEDEKIAAKSAKYNEL